MNPSASTGVFAQLRQSIGGSAEYVVALGLLLVCVAVGLAVWLSSDQGSPEPAQPRIVATGINSDEPSADPAELEAELAALRALQADLQASMSEVEAQAQQEFEAAQAQRQQMEAEQAAEAQRRAEAERRAAELAAQQRAAEERLARLQAQLAERERQQAAQAAAAPKAPQTTPARVDWSSCSKPAYPRMAQLTGAEGTVILAMDLDARGQVLDGRIQTSSGHRSLDEATLRAVRRCDFTPATQNGQPVAITGLVEFAWRLD